MSSQWLRGGKGSDLNEHKLWVNKGHVRGCHQACAHREMCSRKSRDFHGAPSSILFVLLKFFSALKFIVDTVQNDVPTGDCGIRGMRHRADSGKGQGW